MFNRKYRSLQQPIIGTRYGKLVVVEFSHKDKYSRAYWLCKCDCGNMKVIRAEAILQGRSKSCGCIRNELSRQRRLKHAEDL